VGWNRTADSGTVAEAETEAVTATDFTRSRRSSRTPDPGPRIPDPGFRTPDPGFRNGGQDRDRVRDCDRDGFSSGATMRPPRVK